jgi:hypothetical protein
MIKFYATVGTFRAIIGIAVLVYAYAWCLAWSIGNKRINGAKSFCMVRLGKAAAFVLFFRFFNRKISLWAVLLQCANLLALIASTIAYGILRETFQGSVASKVFGWGYAISLYGITVAVGVDILLYMYKEWKGKLPPQ